MKLSEYPTTRRTGRVSSVDQLPPEIIEQLVAARVSGSHSVPAMIEWLRTDEETRQSAPDVAERCDAVTAGALRQWFDARGYKAGAGSGDA